MASLTVALQRFSGLMRYITVMFCVFAIAVISLPALAVEPDEILQDPALENRARDISQGLRCLVCKNQSIDDSDADLAGDLRRVVRERLTAGDSNDEVVDYVVARYGDFVLLEPPMKTETLFLWYGPAVMFVIGIISVLLFYRQRRKDQAVIATAAPLSAEEMARVNTLLDEAPQDTPPPAPPQKPSQGKGKTKKKKG